ncbi:hypothetical protein ACQ4PT_040480 [Festuca glaucescens]
MYVDVSVEYSDRLTMLSSFFNLSDDRAYSSFQFYLDKTFDLFYAKSGPAGSVPVLACLTLFLAPSLLVASTMLFATSHKDAYNESDVWVTYVLLCCTTAEELLVPVITLVCLASPFMQRIILDPVDGWHGMVSQYNLVSFCARKRKPTILIKLAIFNFLRELINKHWYTWEVPAARQILELVHEHLKDGWKEYVCDVSSYARFNDLRGQWSLRKHHQLAQLGWSFNMSFDESVVLWHIATDLCYHNTSPQGDATQRSREISNYMIHLLFIRPEMLLLGTRPGLFNLAVDRIEVMLKDSKAPLGTEETLSQEIINTVPVRSSTNKGTLVSSACKLAKDLMDLNDEERWCVIQGVWVEMLCYSASRCRGYLHAKSLGEGGEYLSYVWLLWSFMGMATLADRFQRAEPSEEDNAAGAPTPQVQAQAQRRVTQYEEISLAQEVMIV